MKNPDYTLTFKKQNKKKQQHINQIDIFKSLKKKEEKRKKERNVTSKLKSLLRT